MKKSKYSLCMLAFGLLMLNHDFILFQYFFILSELWSGLFRFIGLVMILLTLAMTINRRWTSKSE